MADDLKLSATPWRIDCEDDIYIRRADGEAIAKLYDFFPEWKSNRSLMLAGPELYEALDSANRLLCEHHSSSVMRREYRICPVCKQKNFEQIHAALAKARGEQPHGE
jgi:hypothetical protein